MAREFNERNDEYRRYGLSDERRQNDEIDLLDLAKKLLRHWLIILIVTVVGGASAGAYSMFMIQPTYQAQCMLYVNNGSISLGSHSLSLQDLDASQSLVDTYMVILKSRKVLNRVATEAGVDYNYDALNRMVSAGKVNDTEVFSVYVTSTDPAEAELIANTITSVLPSAISDIIDGSSVKIVDYAVLPSQKVAPNNTKNALMGAMAAFVIIMGLLLLPILLNTKIRSEEELFQATTYPLLAVIPDQSEKNKSAYVKKYVGDGIPWQSQEAYNLLRTNVIYSMPSTERGKIIGITSSVASEYKTTTAINTAMTLAADEDKKVLLLDCDIRLSDMAERLGLASDNGLSEFLTGYAKISQTIQNMEKYPNLDVIVGGNSSPNPGELLRSKTMRLLMEKLRDYYDYIVVDFPPATIVTDALELGKDCDGMILVVRQDYTERSSLEEAIRKLNFLDINVLGVVFTGNKIHKSNYKKYYGSYNRGKNPAKGRINRLKRDRNELDE